MVVAFCTLNSCSKKYLCGCFHRITGVARRTVEVASWILAGTAGCKQDVTGKSVVGLVNQYTVFKPPVELMGAGGLLEDSANGVGRECSGDKGVDSGLARFDCRVACDALLSDVVGC